MRRVIVAGLVLVGLGGLGAALTAGGADPGTATVAERTLVRTAVIRGRLEAEESLKFGPPGIQSQWNFKISALAPEGEEVEAGDLLIAFDATEIERRVMEGQSDLATARANLEKRRTSARLEAEQRELELAEAEAEAEKRRLKVETPEDVIASRELEQNRMDLRDAVQRIEHLRAKDAAMSRQATEELEHLSSRVQEKQSKLMQLVADRDALTLEAPSAGTVVYETNWRNEKKKVGDQAHRMETVVSLPDLTELRATVSIDEVFAALVAVGQRVTFALDAFPEDRFEGTIRSINPAIQVRSWRDRRKVLNADIEIENPDTTRMRPGMRLQGELEILRLEDVPAIPLESVTWHEGSPTVMVDGWMGRRHVTPVLGEHDDEWIEVKGGLEVGDRVILPEAGR